MLTGPRSPSSAGEGGSISSIEDIPLERVVKSSYLERLHARRDELFGAHPPPRGKAGDWSHMLLLVAMDVGAGQPMTEDWLLATSRLRSRKTFRDALAFFVEHVGSDKYRDDSRRGTQSGAAPAGNVRRWRVLGRDRGLFA